MLFYNGKNLNDHNKHAVIINLLSCLLFHGVDKFFSIKHHLAMSNNHSISRSYRSEDLHLWEPVFLRGWIWNTSVRRGMMNFCIILCVFGISELSDMVHRWFNGHLGTCKDTEVIKKVEEISRIRLPVLGSSLTTCINLQWWKASVNWSSTLLNYDSRMSASSVNEIMHLSSYGTKASSKSTGICLIKQLRSVLY